MRKSQLRVSKALEILILKAILPPDIFLESMLMVAMETILCRPLIKPFWLGETILATMETNLAAKIFENLKFAITIGLKFFTEVVAWILGIRETTLAFIAGKDPIMKEKLFYNITNIRTHNVQQTWKKEPPKPSGPGALSELRAKITFLISLLEGHITSIEFSSSETTLGIWVAIIDFLKFVNTLLVSEESYKVL